MATEEDHVRQWLARGLAGCTFAAQLAKRKDRLLLATFQEDIALPETVDRPFGFAAEQKVPAIVILPRVRTEPALADQLLALARGDRWKVYRVPTPGGLVTDDVFVGLEWRTDTEGVWSSPMGLASLGTMPQTRRAPYTCLVAWTGGRMNTFRPKSSGFVHLLDSDLSRLKLSKDKYDKNRKESVTLATSILVGDRATNYRNVAFRLSAAAEKKLRSLPVVTPSTGAATALAVVSPRPGAASRPSRPTRG